MNIPCSTTCNSLLCLVDQDLQSETTRTDNKVTGKNTDCLPFIHAVLAAKVCQSLVLHTDYYLVVVANSSTSSVPKCKNLSFLRSQTFLTLTKLTEKCTNIYDIKLVLLNPL